MARRAQQQADLDLAEPPGAFAHQPLLQLARLAQVAGHHLLRLAQVGKRGLKGLVRGLQPVLHVDHALAGRKAGQQLGPRHGLGQDIVRARLQAQGDVGPVGP